MKERKYIARADNGHDYINFTFYSGHRANSKANKADAEREYKNNHGYRITILNTYIIDDDMQIF